MGKKDVMAAVAKEAAAMLQSAGVSKQHAALVVQVATAVSEAQKGGKVLQKLSELPSMASDAAKLQAEVMALAVEMLGQEMVDKLMDAAVEEATQRLLSAMEGANIGAPYMSLARATMVKAGAYVLEHGPQKVAGELSEVAKVPSVQEMQLKVVALCERTLGSEEFERVKKDVM